MHRWIDDAAELAQRLQEWRGQPRVGLDTEFIRERTYYPQLALVQLSVPGEILLADPLAPGIAAALADLAEGLGPRAAAICRELTKLHEEVRRNDLPILAHHYAEGAETRGEFVIVIAPATADATEAADVDALLRAALARLSVKEAVAEVAAVTGEPRRAVYQRALALTKERDHGR